MDPESRNSLDRFVSRILRRSPLAHDEQQAIRSLSGQAEVYGSHIDIVKPGELVTRSCLVIRGLVGRFDQMRDGRRQITSFYIPGDMCDLHSVVAPKASWSITAICSATVLRVPHRELTDLTDTYPNIAKAFWRDVTVDASIFAKWVGNLGRKGAKARLAHVVCEMGIRMEVAGLGERTSFALQATQEQMADAAGMTAVHMNRMLQELRAEGLLTFAGGRVEVLDWEHLALAADFDPAYLMLDLAPLIARAPARGPQEFATVH